MKSVDSPKSVTRQDFLKTFVKSGGLKYEEAAKVYDAMVGLFADAVVTGQKIGIGEVMTIKPVKRPPRVVNHGLNGSKKTIYIGERLVFKCAVFKSFLRKHDLNWNL